MDEEVVNESHLESYVTNEMKEHLPHPLVSFLEKLVDHMHELPISIDARQLLNDVSFQIGDNIISLKKNEDERNI